MPAAKVRIKSLHSVLFLHSPEDFLEGKVLAPLPNIACYLVGLDLAQVFDNLLGRIVTRRNPILKDLICLEYAAHSQ